MARSFGLKNFSAVLILFLTGLPATAQSMDRTRPSGQTPPQVLDGTATRVSHYDPTRMLRLAFVLTPPHPGEERQFLEDVQNKLSPRFHQFPTPDEWNARFGPSVEDEQAVVDWAQSQGLTVTQRYKNRLLVDVEAPAGVIEKALQLTIDNYHLQPRYGLLAPQFDPEAESRTMYSNDRDPVLPARLAGVVESVQGLNSFEGVRPASSHGSPVTPPDYVPGPPVREMVSGKVDADPDAVKAHLIEHEDAGQASDLAVLDPVLDPALTPVANSPLPGFASPNNFWSSEAYDYQALMNQKHCCNPNNWSTGSGANSSIAIAAFGVVSYDDLIGFYKGFPYLAENFATYGIDGTYTCTGPSDDNCIEVTMDTEWALATANSEGSHLTTAAVYVYQGANYSNSTVIDVYNHMLDDSKARVFSTSWLCAEGFSYSAGDCYDSTMSARDHIFASMAGQGWTLVAASGDRGATGDCGDELNIDFPASDPNVIAAGGTLLSLSPTKEVTWTGNTLAGSCATNHGGGTGGFSNYWSAPSYQSDLGYLKRATPDLSLSVQAHNVYYDGAWIGEGGTSVAAPMLAGFFAQEDAYLIALGDKCGSGSAPCVPLGNANYVIYNEAKYNNSAHNPFYDVTEGCNSNDITALYHLTPYCAKPGLDQTTGFGSANMLQLAWAINWNVATSNGSPTVAYTGPATNKWYHDQQTVKWTVADNTGGVPGAHGTGIAGFTQGWDSIPSDPYTEPFGGSGNSFYSGPQYVNVSTGCLSLQGGECVGGGLSQGCHTVHVEGWNNQGKTSGNTTFGPICYDSVIPTIAISKPSVPASGWYTKPVTILLSASDPGGSGASGIYKIYIGYISCFPANLADCSTYTGPITYSGQGTYDIYYFSEDNAGNFSATPNASIKIDSIAPTTTADLTAPHIGGTYYAAVSVALYPTDNAYGSGIKNVYYQLDGGAVSSYTGAPFNVAALGAHTLKYWATDIAGNVEAPQTTTFTIADKVSQTITFPVIATQNAKTTLSLSATATSRLAVSFSSSTPAVCTVSGDKASLLAEGTCTIEARQPGNPEYTPAKPVTQSFKVIGASQAITFPAIAGTQYVLTKVSLTAKASSGLAVGYASATPRVCTVSGKVATLLIAGTCNIQASQPGNGIYAAAPDISQSFTVHASPQTIAFPAIPSQVVGAALTLKATASSALAVQFTSSTTSICTVSGTKSTMLMAGTCTIEANQPGNDVYAPAKAVAQSFSVAQN